GPLVGTVISLAVFAAALFGVRELVISGELLVLGTDLAAALLIVLALPGIYMAARHNWIVFGGFWALGLAGAWLLMGQAGLYILLFLLPFVVLSGSVILKKTSAFEALVLSCGGALLSLVLAGVAVNIWFGQDPMTFLYTSVAANIAADPEVAAGFYPFFAGVDLLSGNMSIGSFLAISSVEEMAAYVNTPEQMSLLRSLIASSVPVSAANFTLMGGLLGYFSPRALCKRAGRSVAPVPKFSAFMLPRTTGKYLIVCFVLGMVPTLLEVGELIIAGQVLVSIAQLIFTVQGLSMLDFLLRARLPKNGGRIAALVGIYLGLSLLGFQMILMWLGLIEQIVRIREKVMPISRSGG
ncbi:MAG: DUF2232 domain-containing protein, partial [Christensenellaceae bacterium]|nr:DUF2232 domain-containing protein [Christensenellaceae bacterium]